MAKRRGTRSSVALIFFLSSIIFLYIFIQSAWLRRKIYPLHYPEIICMYSEQYGLDPYLVSAVICVESRFDPHATSTKDARGLMQITINTGRWAAEQMGLVGYDDNILYDPDVNIQIGCWYLQFLNKQFYDLEIVLASYNAGIGNVNKWLKDKRYSSDGEHLDYIPFKETRKYVKKVTTAYKHYKELYEL